MPRLLPGLPEMAELQPLESKDRVSQSSLYQAELCSKILLKIAPTMEWPKDRPACLIISKEILTIRKPWTKGSLLSYKGLLNRLARGTLSQGGIKRLQTRAEQTCSDSHTANRWSLRGDRKNRRSLIPGSIPHGGVRICWNLSQGRKSPRKANQKAKKSWRKIKEATIDGTGEYGEVDCYCDKRV